MREYTGEHYLPAATAYRLRATERGAEAQRLVAWQREWQSKRASIFFDEMTVKTDDDHYVFVVKVFLGDATPDTVKVELYANAANGTPALRQEMTRARTDMTASGSHTFCATVPLNRLASDYTPRVTPACRGLHVPLEAAWIRWQR